MNYDTGLISRYRSALMGFASILILFAHSISVCDFKSKLVTGILTYGNCGVYAFAFLSGYGLYYAMNSAGGGKKILF